MTGWPLVPLGDHLRIKHGFAFQGEYFSDQGEYIVLTPGNFIESGGFKPKSGAEKYYTALPPPEYVLRRGDLVIAMTEQAQGLLGSSAVIPADDTYLHNQRIGLVEQHSAETDRQFLYYLFNTKVVRDQIQASATGSKVRHTAPARVLSVTVHLPPLSAQRKIAAILSAYDDLVENNNRRIQLLEQMAQRIYVEWFVDFHYPGYDNVRFVDSELGPIPEGWTIGRVGDHVDVIRGLSYRGADVVVEGGIPFINLKCIARDGGFRPDGIKRYVGGFKEAHKATAGDLVMAVTDMTQERRIVARAARVPDIGGTFGVFSMDLVKIVPRDLRSEYTLGVLRYSDFPDRVKAYANGANVLHLHPDRISQYMSVFPTPTIVDRYSDQVAPMQHLSDGLQAANERLRTTRDHLLPLLISGAIDVTDLDVAIPAPAA